MDDRNNRSKYWYLSLASILYQKILSIFTKHDKNYLVISYLVRYIAILYIFDSSVG